MYKFFKSDKVNTDFQNALYNLLLNIEQYIQNNNLFKDCCKNNSRPISDGLTQDAYQKISYIFNKAILKANAKTAAQQENFIYFLCNIICSFFGSAKDLGFAGRAQENLQNKNSASFDGEHYAKENFNYRILNLENINKYMQRVYNCFSQEDKDLLSLFSRKNLVVIFFIIKTLLEYLQNLQHKGGASINKAKNDQNPGGAGFTMRAYKTESEDCLIDYEAISKQYIIFENFLGLNS